MSRYEEIKDDLKKWPTDFNALDFKDFNYLISLIEQMKEKFEVIGEYCEGPVLNYSKDRYKNLASLLIQINEVKNRALKLLEK